MKKIKRKLSLSTETVRNLPKQDLVVAAGGCPTGSWPTGDAATCTTGAAESADC